MKKQALIFFASGFLGFNVFAQNGNTGIGTTMPGSKLTINGSFAATYNNVTTATYTMAAGDYYLAWNGSAAGTVTLPAYNSFVAPATSIIGRIYHIKNTGSAMLTIAANGSELIDNQTGSGVASITLNPGYYAMVVSKGTASGTTWEVAVVASSKSTEFLQVRSNNIGATPITTAGQKLRFGDVAKAYYSPSGSITYTSNSITLTPGNYYLEFRPGQVAASGVTSGFTPTWSWFTSAGTQVGIEASWASTTQQDNTFASAYVSPTVTTTYFVQLQRGPTGGIVIDQGNTGGNGSTALNSSVSVVSLP